MLGDALDVDSNCPVFPDSEAVGRALVRADEQVLNFFVIDLEHADMDLKLFLSFDAIFLDSSKDFFARHGQNSPVFSVPYNRVGFASTRLPVSKKATIVPFPAINIISTKHYQ